MKYELSGYNSQTGRKVKSVISSLLVHLLLFWLLSFSPNKKKHETPKTRGLRIVQIMPKEASAVSSNSSKGSGKKGGKSKEKWKPKKSGGEKVPKVKRKRKKQSLLRKKVASKSENAAKTVKKKATKQSKAAKKLTKSERKKVKTNSRKSSKLAKKLARKRKTYKKTRTKTRKRAVVKTSQKKLKRSKALKTKTVKQRKVTIKRKKAKIQKKARNIKASKTIPQKKVLRKKVSSKQETKKRLVVKSKKQLHLAKNIKQHPIKKISKTKRKLAKRKTSKYLSKTSKWTTKKARKTTPVKKIEKRRITRVLKPVPVKKTAPLLDSKKPVTKRDKRPVMKRAELSVKVPYAPKHKMVRDNKAKAALKKFKNKKVTKKVVRKVHRTLSKRHAKVEFKESSVVMVKREEMLKLSEPKRKFSYGNIQEVSKSSLSESEEEPQKNNVMKETSKSMPEPNPEEAESDIKKTSMFAPEPTPSFTPVLRENRKNVKAPSAKNRKKVVLQDIKSEETPSKALQQHTREDVSEINSIVSRKSVEVASSSKAREPYASAPEFEAVHSTNSEKASFSSSNPDPLEDISEEVGYKSMEELVKNETSLASEQEGRESALNKYSPSSAQSQQRKATLAAASTQWSKAAPKEESLFSATPQKNSLDGTISQSASRESALSDSAVSSSSVENSDKAEAESFQWDMKNEKSAVREVGELSASQAGETNMEYMNQSGSESFRSLAPVSEFSSKDKKKAKVPMSINRPSGGLASSKVFKMKGKLGDSGFVSANVFINGVAQLVMVGENGSFSSVLPLKAGINQVQIYAISPKGKRSEQKFQLWLPPNKFTTKKIYLENPENGAIRSLHDDLLVSGSIDDKSLTVATLYVNDIPRKISVVNGKFRLTVPVEGFHMCKLRVQAKTSLGEIYTSNEATVLINSDPRDGQAYQQPN